MRTQGGGGSKTVKCCGRPLWMAPYVLGATKTFRSKNIDCENCWLAKIDQSRGFRIINDHMIMTARYAYYWTNNYKCRVALRYLWRRMVLDMTSSLDMIDIQHDKLSWYDRHPAWQLFSLIIGLYPHKLLLYFIIRVYKLLGEINQTFVC